VENKGKAERGKKLLEGVKKSVKLISFVQNGQGGVDWRS